MRKGISIAVTPGDRVRLEAIVRDRNSPQKHVWRARIVLLTADGQGTNAIHPHPRQGQDGGLALAGALHARRGRSRRAYDVKRVGSDW
jgi:hypothetical protein